MSRGRKRHSDPPRELKVNIPKSIADELDLMMLDPITNLPRKGCRARVTTELYRILLKANATGDTTADLSSALLILQGLDLSN